MDAEYIVEPDNQMIKFAPEVVEEIRKEFNIHKKSEREEAIAIIDKWIKSQDHFNKKDFSKGYIDRTIITSKGSLERAKKQIDRICTIKTLMPKYFEIVDFKRDDIDDLFSTGYYGFLPKLTKEYHRVVLMKVHPNAALSAANYSLFLHVMVATVEYLRSNDYSRGVSLVFDYYDTRVECLANMSLYEYQQVIPIATEGYGIRVKGVIFITASKFIEGFIKLLKTVLTKKLGERLHVISSREALKGFIDENVLPEEYGGPEISMEKIHNNTMEVLQSNELTQLLTEMRKATTDESKRCTDSFNEKYMGMPGTFRTLRCDCRFEIVIRSMESKYKVISYGPEVVRAIRKEYNIDDEERREEALRIIEEWLIKQDHLVVKKYSRGYIERCLLTCKGSIERTKIQIDKMCTLRTLMPQYFEITNLKDSDLMDYVTKCNVGYTPRQTKEHYRVLLMKLKANADIKSTDFHKLYKFYALAAEFLKSFDCCRGYIAIFDSLDINTAEMLSKVNLVELQHFLPIITDGYGGRIKGLIFLTGSKFIDTFVRMIKPLFKEKIRNRIHVATSKEHLVQIIPDIDILPEEYGGTEKPLEQLTEDLFEALDSEPVRELLRTMTAAGTDENKRQLDVFNEHYMGMPGTFRTMNLD
ncbi:uncharacterized protein LOC142981897 [Anticarsia gemmatalis]|uniref:uncharacterized protein LOC142981897 n=1 Tax=Anticarsia gemmatalis TaxID=129554 RepID=UPI003F76DCF5